MISRVPLALLAVCLACSFALACSGSVVSIADADAGADAAIANDALAPPRMSDASTGEDATIMDAESTEDAADGHAADGAPADGAADASRDAAVDAGIDAGPPTKRVFVSSQTYGALFGGLLGADDKCNTLATAANLAPNFKAWLSDRNQSPFSRMTHANIPYVRMDGTVVATNWFGLTLGFLNARIDVDEKGVQASSAVVWTNTKANGMPASTTDDCGFWGSFTGTVITGLTDGFGGEWTEKTPARTCTQFNRIYCVEQ